MLGTVTGMVEVFDVMAVTGSGNARAMARAFQSIADNGRHGGGAFGLVFYRGLERKADRSLNIWLTN